MSGKEGDLLRNRRKRIYIRSEHNRKHHSALVEGKSSIPKQMHFSHFSSSKTVQDRTEDEQQDNRVETRGEVRKSITSLSLLS